MDATEQRKYAAAHANIRYHKGRAADHPCVEGCGRPAQEWSRNNDAPMDTRDPDHYSPRCRPCHLRLDNEWRHGNRERERESRSSRQFVLWDGTTVVAPRKRGDRNLVKAVCGCGDSIRASKGVLEKGTIRCDECGQVFAPQA